jgi:hypothetical protein
MVTKGFPFARRERGKCSPACLVDAYGWSPAQKMNKITNVGKIFYDLETTSVAEPELEPEEP